MKKGTKRTITITSVIAVVVIATGVLFAPHYVRIEERISKPVAGAGMHTAFVKTNLFESLTDPRAWNPVGKENATFTGITDSEGHLVKDNKLRNIWKDTTVYADYKPTAYEATYTVDGKEYLTTSFTEGEDPAVPSETEFESTHPYEDFKEWKKVENNGSKMAETSVSDKSVAYEAVFTGKTYKIEYDLDGGTADNPDSYQYGVGVDSLNDASKNGYTFDGWYSDAEKTNKVTSISKDTHDNLKLYAKFHENPKPVVQQASGSQVAAGNGSRNSNNGGKSYSAPSYSAPRGNTKASAQAAPSKPMGTYGNLTLSNGYSVALEVDTQKNINRPYVAGYLLYKGIEIIEDHNYGLPQALPATQSSTTLTINGRTYHKLREWEVPGMSYDVNDPSWTIPYGYVATGIDAYGQEWSLPVDANYHPTVDDGVYMPSIGGKVAFKTCSANGVNSHWTIWG